MFDSDIPIKGKNGDLLKRGDFADSLAHALLQHQSEGSFVIGLYGKWGSGKTSLLNLIFEAIEFAKQDNHQENSESEQVIILRFQPWMCSDSNQMLSQFFKQLASAIKLKNDSNKVWRLIDRYSGFFELAKFIPNFGAVLAAFGSGVQGMATGALEDQESDLQNIKDQIAEALRTAHMRLIISIDDIDRLSDDEIATVFQLVKSLADFPNTIYLLAFDYDIVVNSLNTVQKSKGKEYLEKVVQVPFKIPEPDQETIYSIMVNKLDTMVKDIPDNEFEKEAWAYLFQYGLKQYIKSIRDVIRYINVLSLKYNLVKGDTNIIDLLGITCLQVFEPSVYSELVANEKILCGSYAGTSQYDKKLNEVKQTVDGMLEEPLVSDPEAVKHILSILFPQVRSAYNSIGSFRYYNAGEFLIKNNIASPDCFKRYFSLTLESDAISTEQVKRFIYQQEKEEMEKEIVDIYEQGKIVRFLEEIQAYAESKSVDPVSKERISILVEVLMKKWGCFEVDDRGLFIYPFAFRLRNCINPLLKKLKSDERFVLLCNLFDNDDIQVTTLALLLQEYERQHGRFNENGSRIDDPLFEIDQIERLEKIFKDRAFFALETREAVDQYQGLRFLWLLGQIDPDGCEAAKRKIVEDEFSLIRVIGQCTTRGAAATYFEVKTRSIRLDLLENYVELEKAKEMVDQYIATDDFWRLSEEDKLNTVAFLFAMEQKESEKEMEENIPDDILLKELKELAKRQGKIE